jgi:hypothetical protein
MDLLQFSHSVVTVGDFQLRNDSFDTLPLANYLIIIDVVIDW